MEDDIKGHIVKEYMSGNTKIIICDDYTVQTKEERLEILKQFKEYVYEIYNK